MNIKEFKVGKYTLKLTKVETGTVQFEVYEDGWELEEDGTYLMHGHFGYDLCIHLRNLQYLHMCAPSGFTELGECFSQAVEYLTHNKLEGFLVVR